MIGQLTLQTEVLLQEPGCLPQSLGAGEGCRKEHIAINTHVQKPEEESSSSHGYEVVTDSLERWTNQKGAERRTWS